MYCFLQFSKVQYALKKNYTLEKVFFETELGEDEKVRFVLSKVISQSS